MNTPLKIFKEEEKNERLHNNGYVVLDFLNTEEIGRLKDIYYRFIPETPKKFYASTHHSDPAFRKKISDATGQVLHRAVSAHLAGITMLGGAFVVKPPGPKSYLPLHQDWNIVNEKITQSFNIWIPLVDVDDTNGAVRIIPKSHNKLQTYRGPNITPVFHSPGEKVLSKLTTLHMKAGQALLYNHALWHESPVNNSNDLRIGVVYGMVPEGARMYIYYEQNKVLEAYEIAPDFFLTNNPDDGPKGLEKAESFVNPCQTLSENEFIDLFFGAQKQNWFQKLFGIK